MKTLIVGTGALGAYFGGLLADSGADVTFMARGERLQALKENGLTVRDGDRTFRMRVHAVDRPHTTYDLALFTVKSYDTQGAATQIARAMREDSILLPLQNGLFTPAAIRAALEPHQARPLTLNGLSRLSAVMLETTVVEHRTTAGHIEIGASPFAPPEAAARVATFLQQHGIDVHLPENIELAVWRKFMEVASVGVGCALTRLPIGEVMTVAASRDLVWDSLAEIVAVARACGVALPADAVERSFSHLATLAPGLKPSLLVDLEHGRRLEIESLSGAVVALGYEKKVVTPVHRAALGALMPHHLRAAQEAI